MLAADRSGPDQRGAEEGGGGGVHYSHISQHGVVAGDRREVLLQDGHGAGERHMSTAAEQRHAGEAEDGGHQRRIRHPSQTLDAALEATCRGERREKENVTPDVTPDVTPVCTRQACVPQGHIWDCSLFSLY